MPGWLKIKFVWGGQTQKRLVGASTEEKIKVGTGRTKGVWLVGGVTHQWVP